MYDLINKYDDIINLPQFNSKKHVRMSITARAAQFAPFAALTGLENAISETARETQNRQILDEQQKYLLDRKLQNVLLYKTKTAIKYFVYDKYKEGGKYVTAEGFIKKLDKINKKIIMNDGTIIPIEEIIDII